LGKKAGRWETKRKEEKFKLGLKERGLQVRLRNETEETEVYNHQEN